jgi:hypothetical protein
VQSPTTWPAAPGSIFSPQIIIDAANESVTFDVDGATRIRLIYRYEWAVYTDPEVYWDGNPGSAWRIAGDQFGGLSDTALTYEAVVGDHKTLTVRRFESNNVCLYGALIKFGNSPIEVLNLSRASASANLWNDWLTSAGAPEQSYSKLLKGFQPHLVILPSSGNDYFPPDGVTTQAQLNTRLDNLKSAVHALVDGVAIAIPTNPNITVNPGTPDEKNTATFNTWIRAWAATNADYFLDWEVQLPVAPTGTPPITNTWFLNDGIHLRPTSHGRVADYAREILLPVLR